MHRTPQPGDAIVLAPKDGTAYSLDTPMQGYGINKLFPDITGNPAFSMGMQILKPSAEIPEHHHDVQQDVLFCHIGKGTVFVNDKAYDFVPGTTVFTGNRHKHRIVNDGDQDLTMLWFVLPAGLEKRLLAKGTEMTL